jgi:hypothetical protein
VRENNDNFKKHDSTCVFSRRIERQRHPFCLINRCTLLYFLKVGAKAAIRFMPRASVLNSKSIYGLPLVATSAQSATADYQRPLETKWSICEDEVLR